MTLRLEEDVLELLLIPIERTAPLVELRLAPEDVAALREFLGTIPAKRAAEAIPRSDARRGKPLSVAADEKRGDGA